ncbi:M30 family zinc metallopeptidase [Craterilacuibacter sinensis]|uniref:Peptidase M30 n=1 Tax=Craterilacuibacter sinensis TaxID=2686017 RepID=A0A845BN91_9NEIS|nr:hypothetical protein [Craterilacuibacter sinensis]MXR38067.1 hypothetical protein [Craterilacuibacter sinensis]
MKHTSLVVLTSLLMTACGGGGSGGPTTLSGSFDEVPVSVGRCLDMAEGSECAPGVKVDSNLAKDGSTVLTFENNSLVAKDLVLTGNGIHQVSTVLMSNDGTPNTSASQSGSGGLVLNRNTLMSNRMPSLVEKDNAEAAGLLHSQMNSPAPRGLSLSGGAAATGVWNSIINDNLVQAQTFLGGSAALPGGGQVKVWVENKSRQETNFDWGQSVPGDEIAQRDMKIAPSQAQAMADMFATKVYAAATELVGAPWGSVPSSLQPWLLDVGTKDIHIVLLDITPDGKELGTIGYFWSANNFRSGVKSYSNEALVFYMDAATFGKLNIYTDTNNQQYGIWRPDGLYPAIGMTTLAHEFQHMIQFYQKQVRHGNPQSAGDTFQNETAAQALAYVIGRQMFPDVAKDPHLRAATAGGGFEGEFQQSLGYSGCQMDRWGEPGDACTAEGHYSQALSLAMYMLHNYGPGILKDWIQSPENGIGAIEKGLASVAPGTRYLDVVRSWGISTRMEKADAGKRLGFPTKSWQMVDGTQLVLGAVSPGRYFNFQTGEFTNPLAAGVAPRYALNVNAMVGGSGKVKVAPGSKLHVVIY